jgi:3-oxoacyl-(acyl-carrier-protein) synthase
VKPCAVTGLGVASPFGVGRGAFLDAARAGTHAAPVSAGPQKAPLQSFDLAAYPGARVVEVPGFDPAKYLGDKGLRSLDRLTKLLVVAARLALHDAGLKRDGAWADGKPETSGIVVSNAYGSLEAITELDRVATLEDARYINPSRFPLTVANSAAEYASIWEELRAVNVTVSDGNCGALDATACAEVLLDQDRARALLVGGAEAMSEALFLAFHKLGASEEGALLGEGAALLVLERPDVARARGASVAGEIVGYGTAFVPPEREAALVHPSAEAMARAIESALADAGVPSSAVDVVVSGVSGLRAFDEAELSAIGRVLGPDVPVAAPKLTLGETLGAGGAMGMLSALALMQGGAQFPNARGAGPLPARGEPRSVLVTSLGYYGNASAVVMRSSNAGH